MRDDEDFEVKNLNKYTYLLRWTRAGERSEPKVFSSRYDWHENYSGWFNSLGLYYQKVLSNYRENIKVERLVYMTLDELINDVSFLKGK